MSVQLLDKTRKINKLLHNNNSSKVVFNDICAVLTNILDSNVLVISKKGKVLGRSNYEGGTVIDEMLPLKIQIAVRSVPSSRIPGNNCVNAVPL